MLARTAVAQTPSSNASAPLAPTTLQEVVVTGSPLPRTAYDQALPVSSLSGDELKLKAGPTLGETLSGEPGIASSHFTAGASRPVIRGLSDNRVTVLNNGTDILDVSNLSPDHAPSVSPILSKRIEVVRGAATVLYGSSAIGGVVNVIDNRIPTQVPDRMVSGEFDARFGSNNLERSTALSIDTRLTDHWVLHMDGSILRTFDVSIPGYALVDRIRNELTPEQRARGDTFGGDPHGSVPNTAVFTRDFGIGTSYIWDKGFVGVSFNQFLSYYGVPDDPEMDDLTAKPERTNLDVTKRQYSLRSEINDPFAGFSNLDFKFTYTDYKHNELDGDAIGSTFKTNGFDSRLELAQKPHGNLEGSVGAQVFYRNLSVLGDESFLQPTHTLQLAAFAFEELKLDKLRLQAGARVEFNRVNIDSNDPELTALKAGQSSRRDFVPLSAAVGALYDFTDDLNAAFTVRYSERAPTAEELFARGPHDATFQFLVGDPLLDKEKVLGVDLSLRKKEGMVTGNVSVYYNHFFNFIDFTNTGAVEDDLPVYNYAPKRADFWGAEALLDFHLLPRSITTPVSVGDKSVKNVVSPGVNGDTPNPHDLYFELKGDYVHAQNQTDGEPLPRISPGRATAAIAYQGPKFGTRLEVQHVFDQDRVSEFETTTPGYTFLNASVTYTFMQGPVNYSLYVQGVNLTNAEARDHTSFLKDVLPLSGRGVIVGIRATF